MSKLLPLFVFSFLSATLLFGQVEPYDLTVEYLTAPVGIDTPKPRLSWKSKTGNTALKNVMQTAYQICAASSPELLAAAKADLWDSGKVESPQSLNIEYNGKELQTSQRCFWNVKVWYTADNKPLDKEGVSYISSWIMGVMKPEDWKAKWIASSEVCRPDYFDFIKCLDKDFVPPKWIWGGNAADLSVAPAGKQYYRTVFETDVKSILQTTLALTADDSYEVFLNGELLTKTWGHFNDWKFLRVIAVPDSKIKDGKNVLAVVVNNKEQGPTGLLISLFSLGLKQGQEFYQTVAGNAVWTSSAQPEKGWNDDPNFKSGHWKPVAVAGEIGCEPWGQLKQYWETESPAFGKTFGIGTAKKVKTATLHITGLGFYEASLNGTKIGRKVLDPNQTKYDKRVLYSTYDLTKELKQGENRLNVILGHGWYDVRSVAVWNFDNAPWRDFPRMLAQLEIVYEDDTKEYVVSDETWEETVSPVFFDCIRQGEVSMSSGIEKDRTAAAKDGRQIVKAAVVDAPKGKLVAEAIPPTVITQELKPVKITEPKPGVYVVDFGQNLAGWVRFKIKGQQDTDLVRFQYTERLAEDGTADSKPINEHFRHPIPTVGFFGGESFQHDFFAYKGEEDALYEPRFMYHGFQYVEITAWQGNNETGRFDIPVELISPPSAENITACVVHNDFPQIGKFECSNELFNKIQQATLWSYRSNFVNGVPTDCPHREKNGWTGDAQLAAEQAQYNWDNTACYEKWINDLLDEQQENGNLPGIVPTSGWGYVWGNGPAWDSAICIIPWTLYQYKGDKRILETAYPAMKKYVDYLTSRAKENGLVYHGLSDWCPANTKTDAVVTSSVYYYLDAEIVSLAAQILGKEEDTEKYGILKSKIADAYKKEFLKQDGTVANGSQTAQSFPLYYRLIQNSSQYSGGNEIDWQPEKLVFQKLTDAVAKADNHIDVGILGAKSLFHILSKYGRTDLAVKILNQKDRPSYGAWFEQGATTLWEDWGDGASRNHIMFGDVSAWFYKTLGGIDVQPAVFEKEVFDADSNFIPENYWAGFGFKSFKLKPKFPAGIDWVKAEHNSPYGIIKSEWRRNGKQVEIQFSVPVNTKTMYGDKVLGSGEYTFTVE